MRRLILTALLVLLATASAPAAERYAFVVGVDSYANLGAGAQLQRASADARAVAAAAGAIGYRVTLLGPAVTQEDFLRRFGRFADQIQPGDTVLFYFAGHGIAMQGTNYLVPSDIPAIEPGQEMLARTRSLAEADLSAELRAHGAKVVVMVIDACRNNPFPKNGTRSLGPERGLVPQAAEGVFSLYSAGAGQQALDRLPGSDPDPNSVFTRIFVRQMTKPGLNLIDLGESVRDDVAKLAESVPHKQVPAYYNEVRGARFLALAGPAEGGPAPRPEPAPQAPVQPQPMPPQGLHHPPSSIVIPRPLDAPMTTPGAAPPPMRPDPPQQPRFALFSHPIGLDPAGDNWVALRSLPSGREGLRMAKLGPDALFTVIGRQGAWLNVRLRNGQSGWVNGDYVGCCRRAPLDP